MEEDKREDHEFTINSWCWTRKNSKLTQITLEKYGIESEDTGFK